MVLLNVKRTEQDAFLFDTTVAASVEFVKKQVVQIYNLCKKIQRLKLECEELAKHGPAKRPDLQSIDTYAEDPVLKGEHYNMDPTGRRDGQAAPPQQAGVLVKMVTEAAELSRNKILEQVITLRQGVQRVPLTPAALNEAINNIRGAVMIAYPQGLPEWDLVRVELEDREELEGTSHANDKLSAESTAMWFAGVQLLPGNCLLDHLGRNDKTKVVIKLVRIGQGAPAREPTVDEETQKAMLAWYRKKQEEQQRLAENTDDSYTNSAWANPKALKAHFTGVSAVRFPR